MNKSAALAISLAAPTPTIQTVASHTTALTTQPATLLTNPIVTTVLATIPATPQYVTATAMRPVPPLLTTTQVTQRTLLTEQPATAVAVGTPVVISTRPVQQVTQIRIQPQPPANSLQRRGLALTVSSFLSSNFRHRKYILHVFFPERTNVGSSRHVQDSEQSHPAGKGAHIGFHGRIAGQPVPPSR